MAVKSVRLFINQELDEFQERVWFRFVRKFIGEDEDVISTSKKELEEGDWKWMYRSAGFQRIDPKMVDAAIMLWCEICPHDFDVDASADHEDACCDDCELEIGEDVLELIIDEASSFRHNRWIDSQMLAGWRFGMDYCRKEKTDPRIREWHHLHEMHRERLEMQPGEAMEFMSKHRHLFVGRI